MAAWHGPPHDELNCWHGRVRGLDLECFTAYLSRQNFDSQWISASSKEAFKSVGADAFFNVINFRQMLLWPVVLIPVVLITLAGAASWCGWQVEHCTGERELELASDPSRVVCSRL